jgi:hypothetical protein
MVGGVMLSREVKRRDPFLQIPQMLLDLELKIEDLQRLASFVDFSKDAPWTCHEHYILNTISIILNTNNTAETQKLYVKMVLDTLSPVQ